MFLEGKSKETFELLSDEVRWRQPNNHAILLNHSTSGSFQGSGSFGNTQFPCTILRNIRLSLNRGTGAFVFLFISFRYVF